MRERVLDAIYKKLEDEPDNENLQRQITLLPKSNICTIDSFCLDVIKNNFYEIDVSPNFRIADTAEIQLIKQDVLEEIFENKYENKDSDFIKLVKTYTSYRDDTPLKELILKIYDFSQSNPFPEKWIHEKVEMFNLKEKLTQDFSETVWGEVLLNEINDELIEDIVALQGVQNKLSEYQELDKFERVIENDIEQLNLLKINLDSWNKAYELANNINFAKWSTDRKNTIDYKDKAKEIRDSVKKSFQKKCNKILSFTSEEANKDIYDMYDILHKLENVVIEFHNQFIKKKKEKNILDFNDIEHYALNILIKQNEEGKIQLSDVAKRYQEKFNEIAIDEYQDSNLVQEYILTAVSKGNNIFMVGDVKQSIYKFRQAKPELFLEKYKTYKLKEKKKENENLKIQLFKNFRSRSGILDFTNIMFENIMSNVLGDIEYNNEEFLNLGADYKEDFQSIKTEINVIDLFEEENLVEEEEVPTESNKEEEAKEIFEQTQIEAIFVANRINELIKSKFQIYDVRKGEYRNITYKDIVVLLRNTKDISNIYEKEIMKLQMPVFCDTSSEYLDSIEIQTIMSILKIIDNPIEDIPLVTVLRSPIFGFTDNDLVEIRLADKYDNFYNTLLKAKLSVKEELRTKIEGFLAQIKQWREEQEYLALDELIWKIYTDTGYYNYVLLMPNGELRQANLRMLFERAKQYETVSFKGLYNFINFIEKLQLGSGDLGSAKLIGENENVIRIMSIHKSKGLEFPVVFLSSTGKQFNLMDLNNSILLHQDMGLGVKFIDYDEQLEYDTLSKSALRSKLLLETLSEEMRILYVALTRAKEKLVITGVSNNFTKENEKMQKMIAMYEKQGEKINPVIIKKFKKYLDWILLVYSYNNEKFKDDVIMNVKSKQDIVPKEEPQKKEDIIELLESKDINEENYLKIKNLLEYEYKYKNSILIPTKTSVTSIKEMKNKENYKDVKEEEDKNEIVGEISFAKPKFINDEEEKITSAQKGTLIHMCLQRLNVHKNYTIDDIKDIIMELQKKEIITEQEANVINYRKIYNFTKSFIWNELQEAKEIYKEKPFYANISSNEIYGNDTNEMILVQGIIDLYYINKDDMLVLVDYKTDYVENGKEKELVLEYQEQLMLYKRALQEALHRNVDKVYLYSVYLDRAIEVD